MSIFINLRRIITNAYLQAWTCMLALGLSSTITYSGVLCSSQRRHRQLCYRCHRLFDVPIGSRGSQSQWYISPYRNLKLRSDLRTDQQVIGDARRIAGEPEDSEYVPTDPREFCGRIFHTSYMGTENSSSETRTRAKQLAEAIGR